MSVEERDVSTAIGVVTACRPALHDLFHHHAGLHARRQTRRGCGYNSSVVERMTLEDLDLFTSAFGFVPYFASRLQIKNLFMKCLDSEADQAHVLSQSTTVAEQSTTSRTGHHPSNTPGSGRQSKSGLTGTTALSYSAFESFLITLAIESNNKSNYNYVKSDAEAVSKLLLMIDDSIGLDQLEQEAVALGGRTRASILARRGAFRVSVDEIHAAIERASNVKKITTSPQESPYSRAVTSGPLTSSVLNINSARAATVMANLAPTFISAHIHAKMSLKDPDPFTFEPPITVDSPDTDIDLAFALMSRELTDRDESRLRSLYMRYCIPPSSHLTGSAALRLLVDSTLIPAPLCSLSTATSLVTAALRDDARADTAHSGMGFKAFCRILRKISELLCADMIGYEIYAFCYIVKRLLPLLQLSDAEASARVARRCVFFVDIAALLLKRESVLRTLFTFYGQGGSVSGINSALLSTVSSQHSGASPNATLTFKDLFRLCCEFGISSTLVSKSKLLEIVSLQNCAKLVYEALMRQPPKYSKNKEILDPPQPPVAIQDLQFPYSSFIEILTLIAFTISYNDTDTNSNNRSLQRCFEENIQELAGASSVASLLTIMDQSHGMKKLHEYQRNRLGRTNAQMILREGALSVTADDVADAQWVLSMVVEFGLFFDHDVKAVLDYIEDRSRKQSANEEEKNINFSVTNEDENGSGDNIDSAANDSSLVFETDLRSSHASIFSWGHLSPHLIQSPDKTLSSLYESAQTFLSAAVICFSISQSSQHAAAVTVDGHVYTWGRQGDGALGYGKHDSGFPRKVASLKENITYVAVGGGAANVVPAVSVRGIVDDPNSGFTIAVAASGTIFGWGSNTYGQLGVGDCVSRLRPSPMCGGVFEGSVSSISCGACHTLLLTSSGEVYGCGSNHYGQIGNQSCNVENVLSPIVVSIDAPCVSVSAGDYHSGAVGRGGALWTWGRGAEGQLGHGRPINAVTRQTRRLRLVNVLTEIDAQSRHNNWSTPETDAAAFAAVEDVMGDVDSDGIHVCTDNDEFYCGTPHRVERLLGKVVLALSCGSMHTACITGDRQVWTWGDNSFSQLGLSISSQVNQACVTFDENGMCCEPFVYEPMMVMTLRGRRIDNVSCGRSHTLALESSEETTIVRPNRLPSPGKDYNYNAECESTTLPPNEVCWAWGDGRESRLGSHASELEPLPFVLKVASHKGIGACAAGRSCTIAIKGTRIENLPTHSTVAQSITRMDFGDMRDTLGVHRHMQHLQDSLDATQQQLTGTADDTSRLEREVQNVSVQLQERQVIKRSIETKADSILQSLLTLKSENEVLCTEICRVESSQTGAARRRLFTRNSELQHELSLLRRLIGELEESRMEILEETDMYKQEGPVVDDATDSSIADARATLSRLSNELIQDQDECAALEAEMSRIRETWQSDMLSECRLLQASLESGMDDVKNELQRSAKVCESLEKSNKSLTEERDWLLQFQQESSRIVSEMDQALAPRRDDVKRLHGQVRFMTEQSAFSTAEIARFTEALDRIEKDRIATEERLQSLQQDLEGDEDSKLLSLVKMLTSEQATMVTNSHQSMESSRQGPESSSTIINSFEQENAAIPIEVTGVVNDGAGGEIEPSQPLVNDSVIVAVVTPSTDDTMVAGSSLAAPINDAPSVPVTTAETALGGHIVQILDMEASMVSDPVDSAAVVESTDTVRHELLEVRQREAEHKFDLAT